MQRRSGLNLGRPKLWHKPWFVRWPDALAEVRQVLSGYPDLRLIQTEDVVLIRGTFPVEFANAVLDRFQIEIFFTNQYPEEMPRVREIGGRIPWTLDSHVFPNSGRASIQVPEEWLLNPNQTFR